jgi:hypothetical protein
LRQLLQADTVRHELSAAAAVEQGMAAVLAWAQLAEDDVATRQNFQRAWLLQQSMQPLWDKLSHDLLHFGRQNQRPFLIFKGQALAHALYPQPALRSRSDLDLLVPAEHRKDWHNTLLAMGFKLNVARQGQWVSYQNTFIKSLPGGRRLMVDLHWRINNRPDFHQLLPFSRLQRQAVNYRDGHHCLPTLSPSDALQLAVFHYFAHRPEDRKHLWLYDVALLWPTVSGGAWPAPASAWLPEMRDLMGHMADRLQQVFAGESFPMPVDDSFTDKATPSQPGFLPYAVQRNSGLAGLWQRWRNQPSWRARIGLLADYLFQPRAYVLSRYRIRRPGLVWLYYPLMWAQDAWRQLTRSRH